LSISVRAAEKDDLAVSSRLFRRILKDMPYYNSSARWHEARKYSEKQLERKASEDRYSVLVARDASGHVVGFCFNHFDDFTVWIDWLGVDPSHRMKGVGTAILSKAFETARVRGAHKVWCDSRTNNEPAKSLFRKMGFREIATIERHWYELDFILWERFV
jgi:ribosomal-protein-alanine N-acetyltransferase